MDVNLLVQTVAIYALPVLFAITLHEAAHGYVARYFGDMTAHAQGRISLNPIRHIDPVGTIAVPALILFASSLASTWRSSPRRDRRPISAWRSRRSRCSSSRS